MRIFFIRHADPDYSIDGLTPTGQKEANMLAEYLKDKDLGDIYVSPYGRAQRTCEATLKLTGKTAETLPWLREFNSVVIENDKVVTAFNDWESNKKDHAWDILPAYLNTHPEIMDTKDWINSDITINSNVKEEYAYVTNGFDALLAKYGYIRDNNYYSTEQGTHQTITLFAHLGIQATLLAHLFNTSPYLFTHCTCPLPSSITEVVSEEREKGVVSFRILQLGATPHLAINNVEPSFAARFCEVYEDDTRH